MFKLSPPIFASLAALAAAAVLAACGAPFDGGGSTDARAGSTITVRMDEFSFDPRDITGPDRPFRVRVVNEGRLAHNWKVFRRDPSLKAGSNPLKVKAVEETKSLPPGRSETVTVDLRPGRYFIRSTIGNQDTLGMKGVLRIRDGG